MIKGYQCDNCIEFSQDAKQIKAHELVCDFNPANKKCHTCVHFFDKGHLAHTASNCGKGLSTIKGSEEGNCNGWEVGL